MVSNALGIVLEELSKTSVIPIPGLMPDRNNTCLINLGDGLKLQIELDKSERHLLIGSVLGIPARGRYRADLFKEALRANGAPLPRYGIFAFSKKTDNLVLFDLLDLQDLTGDKVGEFILPFLEKVKAWSKAIRENEMPPTLAMPQRKLDSIFNLLK
ncbi:MAG: CesT family type III secretion system chaperone [Parachlamydiaceae bacterium]|nr:CesT family type III secretion system chaperone [Parachlamydiaceae bacterium]